MCCSVFSVLHTYPLCCSVLQCVAVCCCTLHLKHMLGVLQCVAVCCSVVLTDTYRVPFPVCDLHIQRV